MACRLLAGMIICQVVHRKNGKVFVGWKRTITFATAKRVKPPWLGRDGRVVDYSSLENYRTERYRGFESLSLR